MPWSVRHHGVDLILVIHFILGSKPRQRKVHLGGGSAALSAVRLVDENGEMIPLVISAQIGQDKGKLLNSSNNNALAALDSFS